MADIFETYTSTALLLIRHGQARADDGSYGRDTGLSALGRAQAARLADAIATAAPPAVVYVSPLPRALETVAPLCDRLGVSPIVDPRLAEFELGTMPFDAATQRPDLVVWRPEHTDAAGGETLAAFSARVAAFCHEVVERHPGGRVAVVAHSGIIDAAIRWAVGLLPDSPWQHDFDLTTTSITEIDVWPRGRIAGGAPRYTTIRRVGDVTHLGDLVSDV